MNVEQILQHLRLEGFCVVDGVIPKDDVSRVRDSVVAAIAVETDKSEAEMMKMRAKGHRVGAQGVETASQLINHTQAFAPYLSEEQILGTAKVLFGPWVKISSTGGLINNPGNARGYWHSDWPFNQTVASHIPAPYPDAVIHMSTIWMLTPFDSETGGTLVVPGSHRMPDNPSGENGVDRDAPYPTEVNATGEPGSVLVFDSRLWHSVATNNSDRPRVALVVRYAPWWLNLNVNMSGTPEHTMMVIETNGKGGDMAPIRRDVYEGLPEDVKPLYRHWVAER